MNGFYKLDESIRLTHVHKGQHSNTCNDKMGGGGHAHGGMESKQVLSEHFFL